MMKISKKSLQYIYLLKYMAGLKLHQRKSRKELEDIQLKKLRKLIMHAYNNVPYYRELFLKANINPEIKKIEDIQKIPIITKKDIQANYEKIIACNIDKEMCKVTNTTGSTGIPLSVYSDNKALMYSSAIVYYAFFESGLRLNDSIVELTGIIEDCSETIIKKNMVSSQDQPEKIIQMLKRYNPNVLYSFPSVFKTISHQMIDQAIDQMIDNKMKKVNGLDNIRSIFTHGETLTQACRKTIESAFGAEVYNTYGSTEFNRLAFECEEHSGLHIISDSAVIELVKDGQNVGPGEEGEIIVTGLYNYAMPLIRYKLGDIGIMTEDDYKCPCGRNWPLIKSIEGRTDDFLTLPSGRIISPRNINIIDNVPGIVQYRTIQEKRDRFLVQVVPANNYSIDTDRQIKEQIKLGCVGEDVNIEIELVENIARERTGKLKTIISYVK